MVGQSWGSTSPGCAHGTRDSSSTPTPTFSETAVRTPSGFPRFLLSAIGSLEAICYCTACCACVWCGIVWPAVQGSVSASRRAANRVAGRQTGLVDAMRRTRRIQLGIWARPAGGGKERIRGGGASRLINSTKRSVGGVRQGGRNVREARSTTLGVLVVLYCWCCTWNIFILFSYL